MRYVPDRVQAWYGHTPIWTRSLASSLYGMLKSRREMTPVFAAALARVRERQWWTAGRLAEVQAEELKGLVRHAAANVPYYEKLFAEHGINSRSIQTVDDLQAIPPLSKDMVRQHWKDLIARDVDPGKLRVESTSGTTGAPLRVWMDDAAYLNTKAMQWLQHEWAGYTHKEWLGILAGYRVLPMQRTSPPFWVTNVVGKQIHFSSYHLRPDMLPHYVDKLMRSPIKFLLGYPSAIGILARYMVEQGASFPLQAVFLSSEPLYDWQTEAIRKAFGCTIYNYYGQAERVLSGLSCGNTLDLHLEVDSSVVELLPIPGQGGRSMLLATSLMNRAMPLLRYELHDITTRVEEPCACGRAHLRVRPIETKAEDLVVTSTGRLMPPSIFTFPLKNATGIQYSQIFQENNRSMEVRVVTDRTFTADESSRLLREYQDLVGRELDVTIKRVEEIPLTKAGKFRFVISSAIRMGLLVLALLMALSVPPRRGIVRVMSSTRSGRAGRTYWMGECALAGA